MTAYRLGVDVGGTFTHVNLLDEATGAPFNHKVPSTPKAPSQAVAPDDVTRFWREIEPRYAPAPGRAANARAALGARGSAS